MKKILTVALFGLFLFSCKKDTDKIIFNHEAEKLYVPGEVLIQKQSAASRSGVVIEKIKVDNVIDEVRRLQAQGVKASPNYYLHMYDIPNDPFYFQQWNMWAPRPRQNIKDGFYDEWGTQAIKAWEAGNVGDENIFVGVIDQPLNPFHPDLQGNVGNPNEIPNNGTDDDGNGYADDHYGWDFVNNQPIGIETRTSYTYHATHVAGIIGARGNNEVGIAGMAHRVKILSAGFIGPNGGTLEDAIAAIDYFTNLRLSGLNVILTNNSWGTGWVGWIEYPWLLHDAVERAKNSGVLFVCAAGNNGMDIDALNPQTPTGTQTVYPACLTNDNIITVAATTAEWMGNANGAMEWYSNYGRISVDIAAPGYVFSIFPPSTYTVLQGTSMASPAVAGGCVLYKAAYTSATWQEIRNAILNSVKPNQKLRGTGKHKRYVVTGGNLNVSTFYNNQPAYR